MTTIDPHVLSHLAAALSEQFQIEVDVSAIEEIVASFRPKAKATLKGKGKVVAKKPVPEVVEDDADEDDSTNDQDEHTCSYTIKGKEGPRICGKAATNELEGSWYCGSADKGHYMTAVKAVKVKPAASSKSGAGTKTAPSAPPKTAEAKSAVAHQKVAGLVKKVTGGKTPLNAHRLDNGIWCITTPYRIAFDNNVAPIAPRGMLEEDNETITPLTDDAIAFLEGHGIIIEPSVGKRGSKKVVVQAPSDEDSDGESGADSDAEEAPAPKSKAKVVVPTKGGKVATTAKPTTTTPAKGKGVVKSAAPAPAKGKTSVVAPAKTVTAPAKGVKAVVAAKPTTAPAKSKVAVKPSAPAPTTKGGKAPVAAPSKGKVAVAPPKPKSKSKPVEEPPVEEDDTAPEVEEDAEEADAVEDDGADAVVLDVEAEPDAEEDAVEEDEEPDLEENDEGEAAEDEDDVEEDGAEDD